MPRCATRSGAATSPPSVAPSRRSARRWMPGTGESHVTSGAGHAHVRTAVVALGGNALAPAGEQSTVYDQFRHTRESLSPIVELALAGWSVCIVHGNGPQVGDELVRNEVAREQASPLPLGVLVAAT